YIFRAGPSEEYTQGPSAAASNQTQEGAGGVVTVFSQVDPAASSPDTGYAADAGGAELLQSVSLGDRPIDGVAAAMGAVANSLNESQVPYRPFTTNSNFAAEVAYEAVTGTEVVENGKYPGTHTDPE